MEDSNVMNVILVLVLVKLKKKKTKNKEMFLKNTVVMLGTYWSIFNKTDHLGLEVLSV